MSALRPVTGLGATLLLARLTWKRLLRGRVLWASAALLTLPLLLAATGRSGDEGWRRPFAILVALLAVVPPLYLAPAIADEVDDKTFTYLWSRPIARWSVLTGKLLALVPVLMLGFAVAVLASFAIVYGAPGGASSNVLLRGVVAVLVGATSAGMIAVGIGSVVPRFPLATAVSYLLLFDLTVGNIPFQIQNLSITYHVRSIAGVIRDAEGYRAMLLPPNPTSVAESTIWALAIGAAWLGVALWRVRVAEYATAK